MAIRHVVEYYARAAHAFSAGIEYLHCIDDERVKSRGAYLEGGDLYGYHCQAICVGVGKLLILEDSTVLVLLPCTKYRPQSTQGEE